MTHPTVAEWQKNLNDAANRMPCIQSRLFPPKITIMPSWFPIKYGAWTYFSRIFITSRLVDAPEAVRLYLTGHEYGHIVRRHTLLHFTFWLGFTAWVIGVPAESFLAAFVGFLVIVGSVLPIALPPIADRLEFAADDVAVRLYGNETVLSGALWMSEKTGTRNSPLRIKRFRRLGWRDEDET